MATDALIPTFDGPSLDLAAVQQAILDAMPPWYRWAHETRRTCVLRTRPGDELGDRVIILDGEPTAPGGWRITTVLMAVDAYDGLVDLTLDGGPAFQNQTRHDWPLDRDLATLIAWRASETRKARA